MSRHLPLAAGLLICVGGFAARLEAQAPPGRWVPKNTSQFATGALCVSGLTSGTVTEGPESDLDDVKWVPTRISIKGSGARARLTIYDKPVPWATLGAVDCSQKPAGYEVLLSGAINSGTLVVHRSGKWDQILPGAMDLELGRVSFSPQAVMGGEIGFKERLVWLSNTVKIDTRIGKPPTGYLRLRVTDVAIQGLKLALGEGVEPVGVTVRVTGKPVFFHYDLETRELQLSDGAMWATSPKFDALALKLAGLTLDKARGVAKRLEVTAAASRVRVSLTGLEVTTESVNHGPLPTATCKPSTSAPMQVAALNAAVEQSPRLASARQADFSDVNLDCSSLSISLASDVRQLSGPGKVAFKSLTDAGLTADIDFDAIDLQAVSPVLGTSQLTTVRIHASGAKDNLAVNGDAGIARLDIGSVRLSQLAADRPFRFGPVQLGQTLEMPFSVDVPKQSGRFELVDPDGQNVSVDAALERLRLGGTVSVGASNPRLSIGRQGFEAEVSALVMRRPVLYDSTPTLAGTRMRLDALEDIEISGTGAKGTLRVSAGGLIIPDPMLYFDVGNIRAGAPFSAEGNVELAYALSDRAWSLRQGKLAVAGINAATPVDGTLSFDGLTLRDARLSIKKMEIGVLDGVASGQVNGLSLAVSRISHTRAPVFAATLKQPFVLDSATVVLRQPGGKLRIVDVSGENLALSLSDCAYTSSDGFRATGNGSLTMKAFSLDAVKDAVLTLSGEAQVSNAVNGKAQLASLRLSVSGPKDALDGTAAIKLENVALEARLPVSFEAACPAMSLRADVGIGNVDVAAAVKKGAIEGAARCRLWT